MEKLETQNTKVTGHLIRKYRDHKGRWVTVFKKLFNSKKYHIKVETLNWWGKEISFTSTMMFICTDHADMINSVINGEFRKESKI